MSNMKYKLLLLMSLLALNGCKEEQKHSFSPVVGAVHVKTQKIPLEFDAAGKIYGALDVQVRAQVSGVLKERRFTEGQYVSEGESLFLIDPQMYEAAVKAAEGDLAQAESEKKRTERDYNRMKNLFKSAAVSKKDYDDATSALERSIANLKVVQAKLDQAKINLMYTNVKAPISGYVRKECQNIGNVVATSGESSLLTSMVQLDPVKVQFAIAGSFWRKTLDLSKLGLVEMPNIDELKVHIVLSDGTIYPETGKIIFVDKSEDPNTSTITIKAEIPNKDLKLMPGQFVRVKVVGASYQCPVVPNSCVLSSPNGHIAYVIDSNNKALARAVKIKLLGNDAVIIDGLKEGEVVVSEGLIKVRNDSPVTPVFKDIKNNINMKDK